MKKWLLALLLVLVSTFSKAGNSTPAVDGYVFDKKTETHYDFHLIIKPQRDNFDLLELYKKIYPDAPPLSKEKPFLKGFYVFDYPSNTCTIYIIDPKVLYEPEFLGHELTHCIYGGFHGFIP